MGRGHAAVPTLRPPARRSALLAAMIGTLPVILPALLVACSQRNSSPSTAAVGAPGANQGDQQSSRVTADPMAMWRAGDKDGAIEATLAWATQSNPQLLASSLSEGEIAAMTESQRQATLLGLYDESRDLRQLAGEMARRASQEYKLGNSQRSSLLIEALRTLGRVHQNPSFNVQLVMTAEAISAVAEQTAKSVVAGAG